MAAASTAATQQQGVVEYEARLAVANPQGLLRPGMTATAEIATQSTGRQMLVPNGALRFKPDEAKNAPSRGGLNPQIGLQDQEQQATIGPGSRQTVYVLQADGKTLKPYPVTTGESNGKLTVVKSADLKPGMKVVTGLKADTKAK